MASVDYISLSVCCHREHLSSQSDGSDFTHSRLERALSRIGPPVPHNVDKTASVLIDTTPLPDSIPKVQEIGASSGPLLSASFFIGARCKPYNDDYMQCKTEANGTGEFDCLKEGRKVTRCAASVLEDVNKSCLQEFRAHWQCLENNNQQMWQCRKLERGLNKCVFDNLKLEKTIPGTPEGETPVHLRKKQIFAHSIAGQ